MKQTSMFSHEDTPLFSGAAQRGRDETFKPRPVYRQERLPEPVDLRKESRSATQIWQELQDIREQAAAAGPDHYYVKVMAEAVHWGYHSARTNFHLESRLYRLPDLRPMIESMAAKWEKQGGDHFLNGALSVANSFYSESLY